MTTTPVLSDTAIVDDMIGTLARYGWNADRRSLSPIMAIILARSSAYQEVAKMCTYYLQDPERLVIEQAMDNTKGKNNEQSDA